MDKDSAQEVQGPSALVAFVRREDGYVHGPILSACGEFRRELDTNGVFDLDDVDCPVPDEGEGLMALEGWIEMGPEPEPDVFFTGQWRRLTHWEMCRLRFGLTPTPEAGDE